MLPTEDRGSPDRTDTLGLKSVDCTGVDTDASHDSTIQQPTLRVCVLLCATVFAKNFSATLNVSRGITRTLELRRRMCNSENFDWSPCHSPSLLPVLLMLLRDLMWMPALFGVLGALSIRGLSTPSTDFPRTWRVNDEIWRCKVDCCFMRRLICFSSLTLESNIIRCDIDAGEGGSSRSGAVFRCTARTQMTEGSTLTTMVKATCWLTVQ